MSDFYAVTDFKVGDRVRAFHPQTFGVQHWATVLKVGRKKLQVEWHVTGRRGMVFPGDVGAIE